MLYDWHISHAPAKFEAKATTRPPDTFGSRFSHSQFTTLPTADDDFWDKSRLSLVIVVPIDE